MIGRSVMFTGSRTVEKATRPNWQTLGYGA